MYLEMEMDEAMYQELCREARASGMTAQALFAKLIEDAVKLRITNRNRRAESTKLEVAQPAFAC